MRLKPIKDTANAVMHLYPTTDNDIVVPNHKVRALLGLDASAQEFNVVYESYPENDKEIAVQTRSILQVMIDFGSYIDVPETDLAEGRVYKPQRTPEQVRLFPPLFNIRNGPLAPDDAFVSGRYRNRWFWIDDRDPRSKSMFNSLLLLFSLTETSQSQTAPLVTIPTR